MTVTLKDSQESTDPPAPATRTLAECEAENVKLMEALHEVANLQLLFVATEDRTTWQCGICQAIYQDTTDMPGNSTSSAIPSDLLCHNSDCISMKARALLWELGVSE